MLAWLAGLRGQAEDLRGFVLDQAPEVVREIVALGRAEHTLAALAIVVGFVVGLRAFRWAWNFESFDRDAVIVLGAIAGSVLTLIGMIGLFHETHLALMAWFAPRVYVLHELGDLVSKVTGS